MECTFQVGDGVVCVATDIAHMTRNCAGGNPGFQTGGIYTVKEVRVPAKPVLGRPCLLFNEIPDRRHKGTGGLIVWDHVPFRPVKPLSFWVGEKVAKKLTEPV